MQVNQGELVCVVGRVGSGKSSLVQVCSSVCVGLTMLLCNSLCA